MARPRRGRQVLRTRFRGHTYDVHVRGGTLDGKIAQLIVREDSEYRLPVALEPKIIFDVGANIGATAIYLAATYPSAHVYCFEPLLENVELLRRNTACFGSRVTIIAKGLGSVEGSFDCRRSNDPRNFGGGTFHHVGAAHDQAMQLPITTIESICREYNIDTIDLMKLDVEGAELAVIQGAPSHVLANTAALIGELHGVDDWAFLEMVGRTHDIGVNKRHDSRCFPFIALRKAAGATASLRYAA